MKTFLDREFEYGGKIGKLASESGNFKGVYIIALPDAFPNVDFEKESMAGRFKGKDPTVSIDRLKAEWVDCAEILYIGKSERNNRKRMLKHIDFWNGKPVAAWGGRIIAQIRNFKDLEIWYLPCENPAETETALINEFKIKYKKLPFANLRC